jgi:hypothetical protein
MKDTDDDPPWDLDKRREKLKQAQSNLREAQKKHRENHDKCLQHALEEKEWEVKEVDDLKKAKKAAATTVLTL